jgi:hypothetical protein
VQRDVVVAHIARAESINANDRNGGREQKCRPCLSALTGAFTPSTPCAPCWGSAAKRSRSPIGSFPMETGNTPRLAVMGDNRISMDLS